MKLVGAMLRRQDKPKQWLLEYSGNRHRSVLEMLADNRRECSQARAAQKDIRCNGA